MDSNNGSFYGQNPDINPASGNSGFEGNKDSVVTSPSENAIGAGPAPTPEFNTAYGTPVDPVTGKPLDGVFASDKDREMQRQAAAADTVDRNVYGSNYGQSAYSTDSFGQNTGSNMYGTPVNGIPVGNVNPNSPNAMQVVGLVMGILSILTCCCGVGVIFGIAGIILAAVGNRTSKNGIGIAALVTSIVGIVLGFVYIGLALIGIQANGGWDEYWRTVMEQMEEY
ncbi:MAG: hypothetical protein K6G57_01810 [Lachnospiraceae bacterium]|nr:hypothetical protein [Lachnospiraceae bacterium]